MAYKRKKIEITYVVCDKCGAKRELGEDLTWDDEMNRALHYGFVFESDEKLYTHYCKKCRERYK